MSTATRSFEYTVRDRQGRQVKGTTEASDKDTAIAMLTRQGLIPVEVREAGAGMRREIRLGFGSGVGLKDLAIMSRQFATMINSGLSLLRALNILSEQVENKILAKTLRDVRDSVETGESLSGALSRHADIFPPLMINMTRAGEIGGFLDKVMVSIAGNFEAELRLRGKVKSAMTYPVVVFVMAVLAVIGMLLFIVPVFSKMFADLGGKLPAPTRVLVKMSESLTYVLPIGLVVGVVGAVVWGRVKNREGVRQVVDPLKLKMPIFGSLFRKVAISRFSRNLSTMLASGVPLLQSLDVVGAAAGNVVLRDAASAIEVSVRAGDSLAAPLSGHKVFPPMVVQMLSVGEDTGAVDVMLSKIADFYDQEVEATTEALTSLIEPLMIAVLGGVVGSMIIAMYLPIFNVFTLIQ
jgi:type IV pilus assembly protein PilC